MLAEQINAYLVPLTMRSAQLEIGQSHPDWNLAEPDVESGAGPRIFRTHIDFDTDFANIPMVHVGISGFDIDNRDTARLALGTKNITRSGFDLTVTTWLDTRIYMIEVNWLALGHQAST